jgi:hypothetical protein
MVMTAAAQDTRVAHRVDSLLVSRCDMVSPFGAPDVAHERIVLR